MEEAKRACEVLTEDENRTECLKKERMNRFEGSGGPAQAKT